MHHVPIVKALTTLLTHCCTILWNINVRRQVTIWNNRCYRVV